MEKLYASMAGFDSPTCDEGNLLDLLAVALLIVFNEVMARPGFLNADLSNMGTDAVA